MEQPAERRTVSEEMLHVLPSPVQRYMQFTGVIGKPCIDTVYLEQVGRFRLGADRPWMPMKAWQTYTTNPPGYVWKARFKLFGMPLLSARDTYEGGQGQMFGKLAGLFTIFDERGDKLDQGAMLRYLSEMIWFPVALLGDNITWQAVDEHSAGVTFSDRGKQVTGTMYFDDQGRITNFKTQRYRAVPGGYSLDTWSTPTTAYDQCAGLNLPVKGQAVWNVPEGDLPYWDGEITRVVYNQPLPSL